MVLSLDLFLKYFLSSIEVASTEIKGHIQVFVDVFLDHKAIQKWNRIINAVLHITYIYKNSSS